MGLPRIDEKAIRRPRLLARLDELPALTLVAFDLTNEPLNALTLRLFGFHGSIVVAVAIAALLAFALSRRVTGRLAQLSRSAAEPIGEGDLPGPFEEKGSDELALLTDRGSGGG